MKARSQRYPVIYYLPNPLAKFDEDFYRGQVHELLDRRSGGGEIDKSDLCRSGYGNAAGMLLVCELAGDRKLGRLHGAGGCALCRCQFPHADEPGFARDRWAISWAGMARSGLG